MTPERKALILRLAAQAWEGQRHCDGRYVSVPTPLPLANPGDGATALTLTVEHLVYELYRSRSGRVEMLSCEGVRCFRQ